MNLHTDLPHTQIKMYLKTDISKGIIAKEVKEDMVAYACEPRPACLTPTPFPNLAKERKKGEKTAPLIEEKICKPHNW